MSFEDNFIGNIDRNRRTEARHTHEHLDEIDPTIERATALAERVLKSPNYAIQAPEFADLYSEASVRADMLRVKEKELSMEKPTTMFEQNAEKLGKIFEAITVTQGDASGGDWFAGASVLKTSRYDDYFNGTDLLAEWHTATNNPDVLALAVDVTAGARKIEKKLTGIRNRIDTEQLSTIKYFKTRDRSFRGERNNVPQVIIGASRQSIESLAKLWVGNDAEALHGHSIQKIILNEITSQLISMRDYAHKNGKKGAAVAYDRSLSIVNRISEAKSHIPVGHLEKDPVYEEVLSQVESVFN